MSGDHRRGPWRLGPNRVERFYRGGAVLDAFRAGRLEPDPGAADATRPEDWLGSATRSWTPPGEDPTDEGLSRVDVDGRERTIEELLAEDPELVAGRQLVDRVGRPTLGVLVKLLDPAQRLPVHAHPTRAFAREHLGSFFGKTEAWLILATRPTGDGSVPTLRLGFRRDVARDELRRWIDEERSDELLDAMHEVPARAGDAWLVPAGMPHAIGGGVFIAEVQEPTDFSIVAETRGFPIDRANASLRLGWDVTLDALTTRALTEAEVRELRYLPGPPPIAGALPRARLLPDAADPFFRAERWTVVRKALPVDEASYLVGIVTRGEGRVSVDRGGSLDVAVGSTFAIPAAGLRGLRIEATTLELIACRPPTPADLGDGSEAAGP
jgi:mannose-6-phosphate isomerase